MNNNPKIYIVLPAYNAEKTLEATINEIPISLRQHVILVDDASKDRTVQLAKELGLIVFQHERNKGYGANQKTCYMNAMRLGADIVVMLHPDHQYDAKVIPDMVFPLLREEADAVFGSRMLGGRPLEGGMPGWKYNANIILTAFANLVFGRYLSEIHSGFRAYTRKYLETVKFLENSDDFIFDTEIIAQGMACKLFFKEVAIDTRYFPEASSINFRRSLIYGIGILYVLSRYWLHNKHILTYRKLLPNASTQIPGVQPPVKEQKYTPNEADI